MFTPPPEPPCDDPDDEDDIDDIELDGEFDDLSDDDLIGRLPGDEAYGDDDDPALFSDPDEGLPPEKARSHRAMLGVPDRDADEDAAPFSPTRAMQDALIDRMNDVLEDEWEWSAASEIAYDALTIDPTYGRAANALLRCYLTKATLRDMQNAQRKVFDPMNERPNERQRQLAHSYRLLTRAALWNEWPADLPAASPEVTELLKLGQRALRHAYYAGNRAGYQAMRQACDGAIAHAPDRLAVMWYLARLYADKAFFADSAALLSAMLSAGSISRFVLRLYAVLVWWRDQNRWLPWVN
jgi:hypothetical protein